VVANTPEQFVAFQQQEFARWKKVIEVRQITADRQPERSPSGTP
jgi:hypothetical protein